MILKIWTLAAMSAMRAGTMGWIARTNLNASVRRVRIATVGNGEVLKNDHLE